MDGRAINSSFPKKKKGRAINSFSLSGMRVKHVTLAGGERSSPFNHLITSYF